MCAAEHGFEDIVKYLLAQPECDSTKQDVVSSDVLFCFKCPKKFIFNQHISGWKYCIENCFGVRISRYRLPPVCP